MKPDKKSQKPVKKRKTNNENDQVKLVPGNGADVTPEDLDNLGDVNLSMDMGDDEDLKHREHPVDFAGNDLDIPGVELDDSSEQIGSEDEENNSYSLGGDEKENLEETNGDQI